LITRKIFGGQYRTSSSSLYSFLQSAITSSLLDQNIRLSTLFSKTPRLCSSLSVSDRVSHPYTKQAKLFFCKCGRCLWLQPYYIHVLIVLKSECLSLLKPWRPGQACPCLSRDYTRNSLTKWKIWQNF
jgi:hypothetical protein